MASSAVAVVLRFHSRLGKRVCTTTNISRVPCLGWNQLNSKCNRHFSISQQALSDRKYTEKHEWVQKSNNVGTIGITDYAQEALGDVVYVQLPDDGSTVTRSEECGTLESVKAASELYSPVSGKVLEKNKAVEDQPSLINTSCFDEGWLFKVELSKPEEVDKLMNEHQYKQYLKAQRK